jgi:hypothetical protein
MYDELVKQLRDNAEFLVKASSGCLSNSFAETMSQAADAIEEMSAKATPKRVGFAGWKGYRDTRYKCPYCNKYVRNDETYCHKCGQALMFPRISHTPYVTGEKQDVIVTWPDETPKEEI